MGKKVVTANKLNRLVQTWIKLTFATKVNVSDIVNDFTTTVSNKVADARALKTLMDKYNELNRNLEKRSLANVDSVSFGYDNKNAFTIDFNLPDGRVAKLVIENTGIRYLYSDGTTWTTIWSK